MSDPFDVALHEAVDEYFREKGGGDDDHFYGAWSGGSKASGGHPAGKAGHGGGGGVSTALPATKAPAGKPGLGGAMLRVEGQDPNKAFVNHPWKPGQPYLKSNLESFDLPATGKPGTVAVKTNQGWYGNAYHGAVYYGEDGKAAGFVHLARAGVGNQPKTPMVAGVMVLPGQRGKGIGFKMYDAIQDTTEHNLYEYVGQSHDFTPAGKAFAQSWLSHRAKLEAGNA